MVTPAPPRLPPGERLRRLGVAAWSIIGLLILTAISIWVLFKIRVIFPPLVLALLVIYLLNPPVTWLHGKGVPRLVGAIAMYVIVLGAITLLVVGLIPVVSQQVSEFAREWPQFRNDLVETIENGGENLEESLGVAINTAQVSCLLGADEVDSPDAPSIERCNEVTGAFRERVAAQAGRITQVGLSVLEALLVFILAPLLALYLLIDLPQVQRDLLNLVPPTHRAEVADLGSKVGRAIGGFFRGQLFVALTVGMLASFGFWLIGLPFWLVIGAIAGFTNLIPLAGPFIGGALGALVGMVSGGLGLGLQATLVAFVVQQIDNHIISPNVMKRTVQLHPVTVILAILAGGTLAGFWGVLLGVPAVAVVKLLLGHVWATRVLGAEVSPHASGAAPGAQAPSVVPEEEKLA